MKTNSAIVEPTYTVGIAGIFVPTPFYYIGNSFAMLPHSLWIRGDRVSILMTCASIVESIEDQNRLNYALYTPSGEINSLVHENPFWNTSFVILLDFVKDRAKDPDTLLQRFDINLTNISARQIASSRPIGAWIRGFELRRQS